MKVEMCDNFNKFKKKVKLNIVRIGEGVRENCIDKRRDTIYEEEKPIVEWNSN